MRKSVMYTPAAIAGVGEEARVGKGAGDGLAVGDATLDVSGATLGVALGRTRSSPVGDTAANAP